MQRRTLLKGAALLPVAAQMDYKQDNLFGCKKKTLKPARLKEGDTVGMIAPSSSVSAETLARAIANIESLGLKVKTGDNILKSKGYLAGTEKERLDDLHKMFADPAIKAVWCVRGGYGATRYLPQIDYALIKKNPKIFIGYSDITALHLAIHEKTGLVTFHGPVGTSDPTDYNRLHLKNVLMHPSPQYLIPQAEENLKNEGNLYKTEAIHPGKSAGKLIGGNLSLLSAMAGTPYGLKNLKGCLLFMEDIEERPYRIDRMLTQLLQSCDITKAAGIILGVFEGCNPKPDENSLSLMECLTDRLAPLNIPCMYGYSFGHIKNQCVLPVGIQAEMDVQAGTITLLEPAVL